MGIQFCFSSKPIMKSLLLVALAFTAVVVAEPEADAAADAWYGYYGHPGYYGYGRYGYYGGYYGLGYRGYYGYGRPYGYYGGYYGLGYRGYYGRYWKRPNPKLMLGTDTTVIVLDTTVILIDTDTDTVMPVLTDT